MTGFQVVCTISVTPTLDVQRMGMYALRRVLAYQTLSVLSHRSRHQTNKLIVLYIQATILTMPHHPISCPADPRPGAGPATAVALVPVPDSSSVVIPVVRSVFSLLSHGFRRAGVVVVLPCPISTVSGMSRMPGMGCPDWMRATISSNVGVGVGVLAGSEAGGAAAGVPFAVLA